MLQLILKKYAQFKLSNNFKIKVVQAFAYLGAVATLIFWWNTTLFILAMIWGWLLTGFGSSMSLHKMSAHRSFKPKNRLIKIILLFMGTIVSMGSTIYWCDTHRLHHGTSDSDKDPHPPRGSLWNKIKIWFYYFEPYKIEPMRVKDLIADKDHMWFHRNYYKIVIGWIVLLGLIDLKIAAYFYCVSMLYVFFGISYITVIAHIPKLAVKGYRIFNSPDYTYNSKLFAWLLWGEGFHNTHHSNPRLYNLAVLPDEFDYSAKVIETIGTPYEQEPKKFDTIVRL
jgi:stearoyl-CoA desaturase (delta-9 desaturase)|tara:strand:- start:4551 stop:5396 length:846 start_codon:yes stop_codon:yes gene_type:complete